MAKTNTGQPAKDADPKVQKAERGIQKNAKKLGNQRNQGAHGAPNPPAYPAKPKGV